MVAEAEQLTTRLRELGPPVVALSGGVDSAVVAKAAALAWGVAALAVTGVSASLAAAERAAAADAARAAGIRHEFLPTDEFANPLYIANDGSRCYHCKTELYGRLAELAAARGFAVVLSGANADDLGDFRPGLAAAAERGVRHPLADLGFGKPAIRALAELWGLPNHAKPASPCLASRIAVGVEATPERLARVEAAEELLRAAGVPHGRVRVHPGEHARLEVPLAELPWLAAEPCRGDLARGLKALGFQFVSLDLEGFRSGGLNILTPADIRARFASA